MMSAKFLSIQFPKKNYHYLNYVRILTNDDVSAISLTPRCLLHLIVTSAGPGLFQQ